MVHGLSDMTHISKAVIMYELAHEDISQLRTKSRKTDLVGAFERRHSRRILNVLARQQYSKGNTSLLQCGQPICTNRKK